MSTRRPLKYMALVMLDAIEERATRFTVDKDAGVTVHADSTYNLPKAPAHVIAARSGDPERDYGHGRRASPGKTVSGNKKRQP